MLDYSWRCKYTNLALSFYRYRCIILYFYFFCIESCLHSCGNLMDVWCLRLESIPSQNTDSLYVQLSHAIPVWMTLDPGALLCVMYICNAFCLWRQARDGDRVWQNMNWKNNISWIIGGTSSCYGFNPILFVPNPVNVLETAGVCCGSSWRMIWVWVILFVEVSVVIFTLWRIRSGWREILIRFSNVVPMTEFFLFCFCFRLVSAYFCTIDVI